MNNKPLTILHLEDSPDDALFVQRILRKEFPNCVIKVVDNKQDYIKGLRECDADIILSDHSLPNFDSVKALRLFKSLQLKIPFILVTGAVSEEFAVQSLQRGADDYILKTRLARLPTSIKRALDKKTTEKQRDELVKKLNTMVREKDILLHEKDIILSEKDELLHEKDVLIKEVHHRVKNNLAIITSLLNVQVRSVEDESVRGPLIESESRIRSMSMIHEMLYQQANFSNIAFEPYILRLMKYISANYSKPGLVVRYKVKAENVVLNINVAVPCALIMNELIINAYKYAFCDREEGEITVNFSKEDKMFTLVVKDNGIGLPLNIKESTLGLTLVRGLASQLGGDLVIERNHGSTFIITFRET